MPLVPGGDEKIKKGNYSHMRRGRHKGFFEVREHTTPLFYSKISFDFMMDEQFVWTTYAANMHALLPYCTTGLNVWIAGVPLVIPGSADVSQQIAQLAIAMSQRVQAARRVDELSIPEGLYYLPPNVLTMKGCRCGEGRGHGWASAPDEVTREVVMEVACIWLMSL
ncbi:hypothetical protein HAX54_031396 [Datura stramonium]|uniref:Uncharacterized protein n=1 Tax=Datura stramonium TaxID=4076 RepID=A0ABS8V9Z2_DATST|nr:hypothetical protein [Datura stramonium]